MAEENTYNEVPTLDEIVFEKRNKEYGAYDLRTYYSKGLFKAFLLGTAFFVLVVLAPFIVTKIQDMNKKDAQEVNANLTEIIQEDEIFETPEDEPEPEPEPPPQEEEPVEIIQNVVPEPKKVPKTETPPPPITQQLETNTGLINQEGVKTPTFKEPPKLPSTGTKASTSEIKPQVDEKKVYKTVDQSAEFPGGIDKFRGRVQNGFDPYSMEGDEGTVKTIITFVVERDGTLTDVKATGDNKDFNEEAIRTIKSIKNKWAPGKVNGQNVRSEFRFPLSMRFEY